MFKVNHRLLLCWVVGIGFIVLFFPIELFAYNSFYVKSKPSEIISNNAQITYREIFTSKGLLKSNINGLVGIINNYGMFKLSCTPTGDVNVSPNILGVSPQTFYLDNNEVRVSLSEGLSVKVIDHFKAASTLSFAQDVINKAGRVILAHQVIPLVDFDVSYYRVAYLCNEQKKLTGALAF